MSDFLTFSVPPKQVYHRLNEIDEFCENLSTNEDVCISRGPFDVFGVTHSSPSLAEPVFETGAVEELPRGFDLRFGYESTPVPDTGLPSPATQALISSIFDQQEYSNLHTTPSLWNLPLDTPRATELIDGEPMSGLPTFTSSIDGSLEHQFPTSMPEVRAAPIIPLSSRNSLISATSNVPANAVFLLSHYSTTVIHLLTPFRHTKTPWHTLFIPHVKSCLATIAMDEQLDHASLCVFYGTLALSAFSMGGIKKSQTWFDEGKAYKDRARQHVRMMLKTAYDVPKIAKYKFILMALIIMVQVSLFSGSKDQTECYFLEAEKFIRLRGLKRHKSRKVRLLHHCYVFERLFYESTSISGTNSDKRAHVIEAVETSGVLVFGQDSASFRLPNFRNLDQEMQRAKGQDEGENDLFLERIGDFPATLYPEVFGVPEAYMLMLSLVIRLGKRRDAAGASTVAGATSLGDFLAQAKAVERSILRMRPKQYARNISPYSKYDDNKEVMNNMLTAIHEALATYFYRRIYDLDSALLQQRVATIRDCLLRCEATDKNAVWGSAGFIWPAFIAACEAEDVGVQASFAELFSKVAQRSGLSRFSDTLLDVQQIWLEKRKHDNSSVTWLDVMKRNAFSHDQC